MGTYSSRGSAVPTECPHDGKTEGEGAGYWSECSFDSDGDGIGDLDDNFPHSKTMSDSNLFHSILVLSNFMAMLFLHTRYYKEVI
jgi:hypothetical protein